VNNDPNEEVGSGAGDRDFEWEDKSNYREQREIFISGFGLQGAVKDTKRFADYFNHFTITNAGSYRNQDHHYAAQFIINNNKHQPSYRTTHKTAEV
jgi:hypothetical protein